MVRHGWRIRVVGGGSWMVRVSGGGLRGVVADACAGDDPAPPASLIGCRRPAGPSLRVGGKGDSSQPAGPEGRRRQDSVLRRQGTGEPPQGRGGRVTVK